MLRFLFVLLVSFFFVDVFLCVSCVAVLFCSCFGFAAVYVSLLFCFAACLVSMSTAACCTARFRNWCAVRLGPKPASRRSRVPYVTVAAARVAVVVVVVVGVGVGVGVVVDAVAVVAVAVALAAVVAVAVDVVVVVWGTGYCSTIVGRNTRVSQPKNVPVFSSFLSGV